MPSGSRGEAARPPPGRTPVLRMSHAGLSELCVRSSVGSQHAARTLGLSSRAFHTCGRRRGDRGLARGTAGASGRRGGAEAAAGGATPASRPGTGWRPGGRARTLHRKSAQGDHPGKEVPGKLRKTAWEARLALGFHSPCRWGTLVSSFSRETKGRKAVALSTVIRSLGRALSFQSLACPPPTSNS